LADGRAAGGPVWPFASLSGFQQNKMTSPDQIFAILKSCRTKPKFPTQVDVDGMDAYNPVHQSDKQKLFEKLHAQGLLQFVPGPKGRRTPEGYLITPKGQAELDSLRKHPAIAK
jgi:hypothetical protein